MFSYYNQTAPRWRRAAVLTLVSLAASAPLTNTVWAADPPRSRESKSESKSENKSESKSESRREPRESRPEPRSESRPQRTEPQRSEPQRSEPRSAPRSESRSDQNSERRSLFGVSTDRRPSSNESRSSSPTSSQERTEHNRVTIFGKPTNIERGNSERSSEPAQRRQPREEERQWQRPPARPSAYDPSRQPSSYPKQYQPSRPSAYQPAPTGSRPTTGFSFSPSERPSTSQPTYSRPSSRPTYSRPSTGSVFVPRASVAPTSGRYSGSSGTYYPSYSSRPTAPLYAPSAHVPYRPSIIVRRPRPIHETVIYHPVYLNGFGGYGGFGFGYSGGYYGAGFYGFSYSPFYNNYGYPFYSSNYGYGYYGYSTSPAPVNNYYTNNYYSYDTPSSSFDPFWWTPGNSIAPASPDTLAPETAAPDDETSFPARPDDAFLKATLAFLDAAGKSTSVSKGANETGFRALRGSAVESVGQTRRWRATQTFPGALDTLVCAPANRPEYVIARLYAGSDAEAAQTVTDSLAERLRAALPASEGWSARDATDSAPSLPYLLTIHQAAKEGSSPIGPSVTLSLVRTEAAASAEGTNSYEVRLVFKAASESL